MFGEDDRIYSFDPTCVFELGLTNMSLIQLIDLGFLSLQPWFYCHLSMESCCSFIQSEVSNWYTKPWTTHLKFEHLSTIFQYPKWAWQAIKDLVTFPIIQPICTPKKGMFIVKICFMLVMWTIPYSMIWG